MNKEYLLNLAERVGGSFLATFLSLVTVGENGIDLLATDWKAALVGGAGAAVLSLLKGLGAKLGIKRDAPSLRTKKL